MAMNCWEFKECGRETGGSKVNELGVCPAAIAIEANGFCEGDNGGRGCAFIEGTFCGGVIQGTVRNKEKECFKCEFYQDLKKQHGVEQSVLCFGKYVRQKREQLM